MLSPILTAWLCHLFGVAKDLVRQLARMYRCTEAEVRHWQKVSDYVSLPDFTVHVDHTHLFVATRGHHVGSWLANVGHSLPSCAWSGEHGRGRHAIPSSLDDLSPGLTE